MADKTVTVGSAIGLHARPAAIIAEAVVNAGVPVTLSMDGGEPDAGGEPVEWPRGAHVYKHFEWLFSRPFNNRFSKRNRTRPKNRARDRTRT